jgi:hypothetical protein
MAAKVTSTAGGRNAQLARRIMDAAQSLIARAMFVLLERVVHRRVRTRRSTATKRMSIAAAPCVQIATMVKYALLQATVRAAYAQEAFVRLQHAPTALRMATNPMSIVEASVQDARQDCHVTRI